jgi:O-antigen ligase
MIRLALLFVFLALIIVYSWKDWYKSLCGLILLMAVIEHPDMPKGIFGIQGLNPWNVAFLFIVLAWLFNRHGEGLRWDMPMNLNIMVLLYLAVVIIGFTRMMLIPDRVVGTNPEGEIVTYTKAYMFSEYIINTVKWVLPGFLLFDGCRSRSRLVWGLTALLGIYILLGVQIIKWMPLSEAISGESLSARSLKIIKNEIGYHRVNLSMMLAGASWALFAASQFSKEKRNKYFILICGVVVLFAQALTAGRAGYATWGVVGIILCTIRWRKLLFLAPVVVFLLVIILPGTKERMTQGFSVESRDYNPRISAMQKFDDEGPDIYTVTAGRNIAWPYVYEKIQESPFVGYGRQAMLTTGVSAFLWERFGENFPHPHNAYLECLLDNGLAGFLIVVPFYFMVLKRSVSLFRDSRNLIYVSTGGVATALVLALLVASVGSQTFYPREGAVGMWCAIGLMMRVSVERAKADSSHVAEDGSGDIFRKTAGAT